MLHQGPFSLHGLFLVGFDMVCVAGIGLKNRMEGLIFFLHLGFGYEGLGDFEIFSKGLLAPFVFLVLVNTCSPFIEFPLPISQKHQYNKIYSK